MLLAIVLLWGVVSAQNPPRTPLDDYVSREDPSAGYTLVLTQDYSDYTVYHLNLTSQTWLSVEETSTPVWWHWLSVVVPKNFDPTLDTGFMHIGTGSNTETSPPNPETDSRLVQGIRIVRDTQTVFAYLRQIPNQPIYFVKDGSSRYEDDAIAYTWRRYIDDPDNTNPDIIMRMPMTKGAVAAMDAITQFSVDNLPQPVTRFFVSGGSKRGWTTWTVAATDPVPGRVFAIAPKVISILNIQPNFHHHKMSLGDWSFALADYWNEGLLGDIDNPNTLRLAGIVDPYSYRGRLTMPKLLINGASDEFFLPDSNRHFWNDLQEPKYMWMVENTGHSINNSPRFVDIWTGMKNFYMYAAKGIDFPTMSWNLTESPSAGTITTRVNTEPAEVKGWVANSISNERRDFRRMAGLPPSETGVVWTQLNVTRVDALSYSLTVEKPTTGWRAFFIEAQFPGLAGSTAPTDRLTFSTEVNIIPDTLPFPKCSGYDDCQGFLV